MKQRRLQLPLAILVALTIALFTWKWQASRGRVAVEARLEPIVVPTESEDEEKDAVPTSPPETGVAAKHPTHASPDHELKQDAPSSSGMERVAAIVESVNPLRVQDIRTSVQKLRGLPAAEVSAYFRQSLKNIGTGRPADRDRLIMMANDLQSKTDLPFWTDLLKRETPRYPDEQRLRNPSHPTLESRFVDLEQLQAIRNIGLLARKDRTARRVLMEIILQPDPSAHRVLHRERAYVALKEADLTSSLRIIKQLPANDELLKRL